VADYLANGFLYPTNDSFAPSGCHLFHPFRLFLSSWFLQVCQFANMMNFYVLFRATEFTSIRKNPLQELGSRHFSLPKSPLSHSFIGVKVEKGAIQARRHAKKDSLFHIEELFTDKAPSLLVS
jgi:hypothetical protein